MLPSLIIARNPIHHANRTTMTQRSRTPRNVVFALLAGLFILAIVARGFFTGEKAEGVVPSADAGPPFSPPAPAGDREDITFILGEDSGPTNRYYTNARAYYESHPDARTEHLVTHLRSLLGVRDYLESHPPANGHPWGRINLVVHSNEWTGMETPVLPGGKRSDAPKIQAAIDQGYFPPIVDALIDQKTEIVVFGCALGRDETILHTLRAAFGGAEGDPERPQVRSSRYFINYLSEWVGGRPHSCRRLLTDFRYAFYPTGYRPADYQLVDQLQRSYPNDSMAYSGALARKAPRFAGDSYHHTFRVPIVKVVLYERPEDRPDFSTETARSAWFAQQTDLDSVFSAYQLTKEQFTWTYQKIRYEVAPGEKVPAVKLIGLCDVVCILQPLQDPQGHLIDPNPDDLRFFASTD